MRQIDITFDTLGARAIPVGYQGDNLALQIAVDCSEVVADYPNAMAHIIVTDPNGDQHEDRAWMRDGVLLWQVRTADTAIAGTGDVRVSFMDTDEDAVLKTAHAAIVILELTDADDEIPTQLANWMAQAGITLTELRQSMVAIEQMEASTDKAADAANAAAARLNDMDVLVETLEPGSSATVDLTDVDGHAVLTLGIPKGADGQDGADGINGQDGANGQDGQDGQDGQNGADGQDGVSPTVLVSSITGGHQVSITDANGTTTFDVMDGADGQDGQDGAAGADGEDGTDGVSPSVTITEINGGHTVTITDADGDHSFNVMDGADGQDGQDGAAGADGQTGPAGPGVPGGGTTGQVLKKKSGTDYDTEWANESGGGSLPSGGETGTFLVKDSSTDYDTTWKKVPPLTMYYDPEWGTYAVGDYCIYDGILLRCKVTISTPEAFNSQHWQATFMANDVAAKYTKPQGGIPSTDLASGVQTSLGKADSAYQKPSGGIPGTDLASGVIPDVSGFYTKPSGGIPSSDLASAVQTSLGKADTAYQKPSGGIPGTDLASGVIPDISGKLDAPSTAGTNGQVLTSNGSGGQTWQTPSSSLPAVSSSDNGKVLMVVSGAWAAATIPSASGVSF